MHWLSALIFQLHGLALRVKIHTARLLVESTFSSVPKTLCLKNVIQNQTSRNIFGKCHASAQPATEHFPYLEP
jgi:hypothetical protein